MELDEIHLEWQKDADINISQLSQEARNVPLLHAKYYRHYTEEHKKLRKLRSEHSKLLVLKTEYYQGHMAKEDLQELGWDPYPKKIIKQDMNNYINADPHVIKLNLMIGDQAEKVELIEAIIKSINNRGYLLKTALDFERFQKGES